jgi:hypothetical protein
MNKYRPGGRCGGDSATKQGSNPEFNASLASLLQQRDRQDAFFSAAPAAPAAVAEAEAQVKPNRTEQKNQLAITKNQSKLTKEEYIQLLLAGDYEE